MESGEEYSQEIRARIDKCRLVKPEPKIIVTGVSEFVEGERGWMYKDMQKDLIQSCGIPAKYHGSINSVDGVIVMNLEMFSDSKKGLIK